jgi:membrane protein
MLRRPDRRPGDTGAGAGDGRGRDAGRPADIPGRGWWDILRRVRRALARDHIWVASAAVAYCALFAAIPGAAVALVAPGLLADPAAVGRALEATRGLLPAEAVDLLAGQLGAVAEAGTLRLGASGLGGALLAALWAARAGAATLIGTLNIAYREPETRGFWRYQAAALAVAAGAALYGLAALALLAVLPAAVGTLVSPGSGAAAALALARWPALAALTVLALSAVYRFAPDRRMPKWRWVSAGALAATALWLAGSAAFSWYVARSGSYGQTFGALGALMALLGWLYLGAFSVLLGAELNAEVERQTGRDTTEGPELPEGRRGARVADDGARRPDG